MRVKELIAELSKLDPEAIVVTVNGDCDDLSDYIAIETGFVDRHDDPFSFKAERDSHHAISAVKI